MCFLSNTKAFYRDAPVLCFFCVFLGMTGVWATVLAFIVFFPFGLADTSQSSFYSSLENNE